MHKIKAAKSGGLSSLWGWWEFFVNQVSYHVRHFHPTLCTLRLEPDVHFLWHVDNKGLHLHRLFCRYGLNCAAFHPLVSIRRCRGARGTKADCFSIAHFASPFSSGRVSAGSGSGIHMQSHVRNSFAVTPWPALKLPPVWSP